MVAQRKTGFLLINLAIAFSIILIIVSLAASQTSFFRRFLMRSEVEKISTLFFYLNQRALATNKEQTVHFDVTTNSYSYNNKKEQLAPAVHFGVLPNAYGPPSNPKKPLNEPITFVDDVVHFYPDGTMSSGSIYLADNDLNLLYALTISVGHISYLRKYHFNNGSWIPIT